MLKFLADIFQPGSPESADSKKPRRSSRIQGARAEEVPEVAVHNAGEGPSTPARQILEAKNLASPVTKDVERTPASSPGPMEPTQVASQFWCPPLPEEDMDTDPDPNVWGCLVPVNTEGGPIKLNKNPDTVPGKSPASGRGKKKTPSGFLVGRHPECDLHISSAVISNRHCVIYKVSGESRGSGEGKLT